jgi:tetratricopeptide (TPR) repeat protein
VDGSVNLGKVYQSQQKYEDAEKLYLRAIKIQEQISGAESLDVGYALNNLGLLYAEQKNYDKAEEILRRALKIREKLLSSNDADIAVTLVNLGKVYSDQDKLTEAEVIYHKALQIFVYAGDNAQNVITTGENLIRIYEKQMNYKELEKMLRFCILVIENHNGKNDSNLLPFLDKQAIVLRKLKRNAEALKVETRIKRIEKLK